MDTRLEAASPPDANAIETLAADLAIGNMESVARLFTQNSSAVPTVTWDPKLIDLHHPVTREFYRATQAALDAQGKLSTSFLDSEAFTRNADWTMVLERTDEPYDFRYKHYGKSIAASFGRDLTGTCTSELGGHISTFFLALYAAAERRDASVRSVHEPPRQVFAQNWRRLIVPTHRPDGGFGPFVVSNVPDNDLREGLEALPDAVMVVDANSTVCFANKAARKLFGQSAEAAYRMSLKEFANIEIPLPGSPEELARSDRQFDYLDRVVSYTMIVPLHISVGATYYRDVPFYMITAREEPGSNPVD